MSTIVHIIAALSPISSGDLPQTPANRVSINIVKDIIFGIIGAMALLVMVISGLRYITSAGDPQKAANAKNGVIYSLVGLALAIISDALVSFVVKSI